MDWDNIIGMATVQELYGRDKSTINRAISSGKIKEGVDCKKLGRDWAFYKPNMDKIYLQKEKNAL